MKKFTITSRNKVNRVPKRANYDAKTLYTILDNMFVCHVAFILDKQPFIIPMAYGRRGNKIYLHGATSSRLMKILKSGIPVCICVTLLDGVVLARSSFHSSMNYRSAVVFGTASLVEEKKKNAALKIIAEHIAEGRWNEARKPNFKELKATSVLEVMIDQASSKIRTGPPLDEPEDYDLPIWAGVVPLNLLAGKTETDPLLKMKLRIPESVKRIRKEFS
jgi:hypothetical protein